MSAIRSIAGTLLLAAILLATGQRGAATLAIAAAGLVLAGVLSRSQARGARTLALALPAALAVGFALRYALEPAPASARLGWIVLGLGAAALALVLGGRWRWITRALVACTSLALGLAVAEGYASDRWPRHPHGLEALAGSASARPYRPDPELGHAFAPGFRGRFCHPEYEGELIETNSDGFRDLEWPAPERAAPGELRVLVLGDSTTVGFGVRREEAIPALLAGELERLVPERALRVLNAGVPGYGARHAQVLLERVWERVRPDLALVLFYDGNDLADARTHAELGRDPGGEQRAAVQSPEAGDPTLLSFGYWRRYSILWDRIAIQWAKSSPDRRFHAPGHAFDAPLLEALRREPGAGVREELEWTAQALLAMAERCRAGGAQLLVARIPARVQVDRGALEKLLERLGESAEAFDPSLPGRAVLERCEQAGIATVDLSGVLSPGGSGAQATYFLEGHPSRLGNRLAAEELARSVTELLDRR